MTIASFWSCVSLVPWTAIFFAPGYIASVWSAQSAGSARIAGPCPSSSSPGALPER